jgi:succinate dehydrogenase/fumarate reductase cytochrome b subunit (b558 family)
MGRKLFSLSGVLPLAFFLVEHIWANASALRGQDAYVATIDSLARIPLLPLVELVLVFVPLVYHAFYGLYLMRENVKDEPPYGRTLALANRIAAITAFAFITWHFWETRVQAWRGLDPHAFYATLVWRLSSTWHGFPWRAVLYLLGVTASVAHLAISAWAYGITARWFKPRRGAWACGTIGALLFLTSAATVVSLATGMEFTSTRKPTAVCTPQQK